MGYPYKIATCCYCGARAALVLKKAGRHELACSQCGAPLHALKMRPIQKAPMQKGSMQRAPTQKRRVPQPTPEFRGKPKVKPRKKISKASRFLKEIFEEAFDFVEDIFD